MTKLEALNNLILKVTGEINTNDTIEESLSFLAEKLTGEYPNTDTIAEVLEFLAEKYEGGGSGNYNVFVNTSKTYDSSAGIKSLITKIGDIDTSDVTTMYKMFSGCTNLEDVPELDTSNVTYIGETFSGCTNLTDDSLNNIMAMCIKATKVNYTTTLRDMGLTSEQATRCQGLSNYQAFLDAHWTTGY